MGKHRAVVQHAGDVGDEGELAGVAGYEVVELFPLAFPEDGGVLAGQYQPPVINVEQLYQLPADLPPGLYFRYFETPNQ